MSSRYSIYHGSQLLGHVDILRPLRTRDGRVRTSLGHLLKVADFAEMEHQICDSLCHQSAGEQHEFGPQGQYRWQPDNDEP
jgi:hypothetical protein